MNSIKGKNKILIHSLWFLIALIAANHLQESSAPIYKHIVSIFIILYMFYQLFLKRSDNNITIIVVYFFIFSLYPRVLYDESFYFVEYFQGYYKIIIIGLFVISISPFVLSNKVFLWLFLLHIIAFIVGFFVYGNIEFIYINMQYILIIYSPFVILTSNKTAIRISTLLNILHSLSISFVFFNLYVWFFKGISIGDNGELFITFGPTNLLVFILLSYFSFRSSGVVRLITVLCLLLYTPIKILSINSQEILIIFILLMMFFISAFDKRKLFLIFPLLMMFFFSYTVEKVNTDNGWINLKVNQVISLISTDSYESLPNSVYIRVLEFQLLSEQVLNDVSVLIGKGLGATLSNDMNLLYRAQLHEATYTNSELLSGEIYNIHESLYKYILRYGLLGIVIYIYIYITMYAHKKHIDNKLDKKLFVSLLLMSFYYYGWSYKFLFIINLILAVFIKSTQRKK